MAGIVAGYIMVQLMENYQKQIFKFDGLNYHPGTGWFTASGIDAKHQPIEQGFSRDVLLYKGVHKDQLLKVEKHTGKGYPDNWNKNVYFPITPFFWEK